MLVPAELGAFGRLAAFAFLDLMVLVFPPSAPFAGTGLGVDCADEQCARQQWNNDS